MNLLRPWQSVVTRLVTGLVVAGILLSAGLAALEVSHSQTVLRIDIARRFALKTRNLQQVLRGLLQRADREELTNALTFFSVNEPVDAIRLTGPGLEPVELGDWNRHPNHAVKLWPFSPQALTTGDELDLSRCTLIRAPFTHNGSEPYLLELAIDGPTARAQSHSNLFDRLTSQWLLLALMTLLGLLMIRRWFTEPLSQVVQLITQGATPEPLRRLARRNSGEFRQLPLAIAAMLERMQRTSQRLAEREEAFKNLYEFAPTAMICLDPDGVITCANRRAASLFSLPDAAALLKRRACEFICDEDRPLLQQTIDRAAADQAVRCELRISRDQQRLDLLVEALAVRNEDGLLQSVRLSLLDITTTKASQRQLETHTRLLNSVVDHMSDAILLVDKQGRVAAFNEQLANLLHRSPESLHGATYHVDEFWDDLGVLNRDLFLHRLRQIQADENRPAQERFETAAGVFLIQGIPVHDETGGPTSRLWVVRETTSQEQSQRLLNEQQHRLHVLKRVGQALCSIRTVDALLDRTAHQLYELLEVEAVGIAVRHAESHRRSRQVLHRGPGAYLLDSSRAVIDAVERDLMPEVLAHPDVLFWPELPPSCDWSRAFAGVGFTSLAAGPIRGSADTQGIIWIARRGGQQLGRQHLHLLETLSPLIAARLEGAQASERLQGLDLVDPITGLPAQAQFDRALGRLVDAAGQTYSIIVLELDHYRRMDQTLSRHASTALLQRVATRLLAISRRSCFIARFAGGSFALLVPELPSEHAFTLGQRLREAVGEEALVLPTGATWPVTASVGVATCPVDGNRPHELLDLAIVRVTLAKRAGRNCVVATGPIADRRAS
jgi:diguanylate cyclase (GGDEF)-like protein/PAS domain S-box-containing protein